MKGLIQVMLFLTVTGLFAQQADDEFQTILWEALALTLAEKAGIRVPRWRIEKALNEEPRSKLRGIKPDFRINRY